MTRFESSFSFGGSCSECFFRYRRLCKSKTCFSRSLIRGRHLHLKGLMADWLLSATISVIIEFSYATSSCIWSICCSHLLLSRSRSERICSILASIFLSFCSIMRSLCRNLAFSVAVWSFKVSKSLVLWVLWIDLYCCSTDSTLGYLWG